MGFIFMPPIKKEVPPPLPTGNALPGDVRSGKTFTGEGGIEVTGTLPERSSGALTVNPGYSDQTLESGIYNGPILVPKLAANVVDTTESAAPASAAQILTGRKATVNGAKVTGSMANQGSKSATLSTQGQQYTIPGGYHDGTGKITASFANLSAGNVKNGVTIGGVTGSLVPATVVSLDYTPPVKTITTSQTVLDQDIISLPSGTKYISFVSSTATASSMRSSNDSTVVYLLLTDGTNVVHLTLGTLSTNTHYPNSFYVDLVSRVGYYFCRRGTSEFLSGNISIPTNFNIANPLKIIVRVQNAATPVATSFTFTLNGQLIMV